MLYKTLRFDKGYSDKNSQIATPERQMLMDSSQLTKHATRVDILLSDCTPTN